MHKPKKALTLPNGYKQHILFKGRGEGKGVICYEHIIIYLSVYGEYPEGKVIDHIDNNPSNNRISNLQCLTPEQNKTKSPTSRANVKCKRIRSSEIAAMIELFKQGRSSLFISKLLEINRVTVQYYKKKWVNGERFKYLED